MRAMAYDVETTGLFPYQGDKMFAYATCDQKGDQVIQRIDGSALRRSTGRRKLEAYWNGVSAKRTSKVMHNAKFDMTFTERQLGRHLDEHKIHCTHKQSHILQNHHHNHSLDQLSWELGEYPHIDGDMKRLAEMCGGFQKVPEHKMTKYQGLDVERGMLLHMFFYPKIKKDPQLLEIYNTEMELIRTTMRMEARGLMIHTGRTKKMIVNLEQQVENLREGLFAEVGRRFNPNSDAEMRNVLFKQFKMPIYKRTKKAKLPSVDKYVLAQLHEETNHPIINIILKLRSYSKGVGTLESYLEIADENGIIHPNINTCKAITSRESSENPSLMNVQKGGVLLNPFPVLARDAFRPRPGFINLHIDYSGIEMRLLIYISRDERMMHCLNHGDEDVHSLAAEVFYGKRFRDARGQMRKTLRNAAKNANFAIPYGASAHKVAMILGLSRSDANAAYKRYKAAFPRLCGLARSISEEVRANGFIVTAFGRVLHVPKDRAYMGVNYYIQGTAAGILKRAQNRVHAYNVENTSNEVKILLPIHDEIVEEYPRDRISDLPGYIRDIRSMMIDFPQFDIPLEVEADYCSASWEYKKKLKIAA